MFSCKVHFDKDESEESYRAKLNANLPKDVKVFCVIRCSNRFNAKYCTSDREYSYYLPSFMLTKISDLFFGTSLDQKKRLEPPNTSTNEEEKKDVKPSGGIKIIKQSEEDAAEP